MEVSFLHPHLRTRFGLWNTAFVRLFDGVLKLVVELPDALLDAVAECCLSI